MDVSFLETSMSHQREGARWSTCSAIVSSYALAAPGANTGAVSGGFTVSPAASMLRITVSLTTSSVLNLTVTDGTTAYKWGLNESVALNAADVYTLYVPVRSTTDGKSSGTALTYNIEVETDSIFQCLWIEELQGAVAGTSSYATS